jgi:hypothetical protein
VRTWLHPFCHTTSASLSTTWSLALVRLSELMQGRTTTHLLFGEHTADDSDDGHGVGDDPDGVGRRRELWDLSMTWGG